MQFFQHVKEQRVGSSGGTYSAYWVTQTTLGSCICSCHPLSCNLKSSNSLPTSSDTLRQKTQQRYCTAVMCLLRLWCVLGRGQGGGGNTSCKLHRRLRQALARSNATAVLKDATSSVLPQGVQYFRLMGTHFSDTSEITYYAVSKQQRPPTGRWVAGGTQHPKEKSNRAILASYISTPAFLPAPQGSDAQHWQSNKHQSTHQAAAICFPMWWTGSKNTQWVSRRC